MTADSGRRERRLGYAPDFALALIVHVAIMAPVGIPLLVQWIGHRSGHNEPIIALLAEPEKKPPVKAVSHPPATVPYQRVAEQKISQLWRGAHHGLAANRTCLVHVGVRADGTVLLARIARSSGSLRFDESVLQAVRASSPLMPPPDGIAHGGVYEFDLLFDPRGG